MKQATREDIEAFLPNVQKKMADGHIASVEYGSKYAKIVTTYCGARSAYGFIDMGTGNILKPANWKAPAKHARGNIFNENPASCCGPYGIAHLR